MTELEEQLIADNKKLSQIMAGQVEAGDVTPLHFLFGLPMNDIADLVNGKKDMDVWIHMKTSKRYNVLHFGNLEATVTPCVVYQSIEQGSIWVRPLAEFLDKFKPEGK